MIICDICQEHRERVFKAYFYPIDFHVTQPIKSDICIDCLKKHFNNTELFGWIDEKEQEE